MEEILASIRRIIADDEAKPAGDTSVKAEPPKDTFRETPKTDAARIEPAKPVQLRPEPARSDTPKPATAPKSETAKPATAMHAAPSAPSKPAAPSNNQDDIDALLAGLDDATSPAEVRPQLPDGDVFELTDDMALPDPPAAAAFRKVDPDNDVEFSEPAALRGPRDMSFPPAPPSPPPEFQPQMMSRATVSAVESAFNSLATTVLSNNARTLEDLVKEMLRPMLKSWLDDNLPGLVERIVKAEIERVSRGR